MNCAPVVIAAVALASVWGVRTTPTADGEWTIRWEGDPAAPVRVDGRPRAAHHELRVDGDARHRVEIGNTVMETHPSAVGPCAPIRFAVLGDGRAAVDGIGPSAYWPAILDAALRVAPAFVVNTGDLVKRGRERAEWDAYLRTLPPWPPMWAVRGNHDRGGHFEALGLGGEQKDGVAAWRAGPVDVVGIDTEVGDLEPVARALDRALTAARGPWRIVVGHRPVWSRGNHGSDELGFNARLVPILDRHRVDVYFAGHDHNYERFCASVGIGVDRRCVDVGGTVYIVTGGAAAFTNPVPGVTRGVPDTIAQADSAASRIFSGAHHFVEVEVEAGAMTITAHRTRAGNVRGPGVLDRVTLSKPTTSCR